MEITRPGYVKSIRELTEDLMELTTETAPISMDGDFGGDMTSGVALRQMRLIE